MKLKWRSSNKDFQEHRKNKDLTFLIELSCTLAITLGSSTTQSPTWEWKLNYFGWVCNFNCASFTPCCVTLCLSLCADNRFERMKAQNGQARMAVVKFLRCHRDSFFSKLCFLLTLWLLQLNSPWKSDVWADVHCCLMLKFDNLVTTWNFKHGLLAS